ncbi:TlpA family protein disulfide reductase [Reichenbachiella agarivorans]|uniref:TlpA family protein disulfide reductase n=1 Tax=Reichenbachiella agarivorans TaxID=2979464 RepID=A0ABY6CMZ3_9BACT|nr:TlpA disulfide reductase family protein [Reichenbachiella agarivorans]UXP31877.1 TlpA family protein disulfide reductase [Reichenbachiella agarivorans]
MKNTFLLIVCLAAMISCSKTKEGAVVTGNYENPIKDELVKVELIKHNELTVIDSFYLDTPGDFSLNIKLDEPSFVRLNFYNKHIVNMVLTNDDEVVLVKTDEDFNQPYRITGSQNTDYIYQLTNIKNNFEAQTQDLNAKFIEARNEGNMQALEDIKEEFLDMQNATNYEIKKAIWKMDNSISGLLATSFLDEENEFSFLDSLATKYNEQIPNSSYTQDLVERVNSMRNLAIGSVAPEINLPTPDGEPVKLSSFRGKYVLIDFWAAWCRPCRMENPNVVRMYNEYHDKGFDILSVSLDRDRAAWVDAIQKDNLTWTHVSDLKYFQSEAAAMYKINSIPATYLIGPDGTIIGKNLRGPSLEAKLKEIFGAI